MPSTPTPVNWNQVFWSGPLALLVTDPANGMILDVNDSLCRLLGYTRIELVGHTTGELRLWRDAAVRESMIAELLAVGRISGREYAFQGQGGRVVWTRCTILITDWAGQPAVLSFVEDLAAEKAAELAKPLQLSELFAVTFRDNPQATVLTDVQTQMVLDINTAYELVFRRQRSQVVGRRAEELAVWDDLGERRDIVDRLLRGEVVRAELHWFRRGDGSRFRARLTATRIDWAERPCLLFLLVDVSEELAKEKELSESRQRFEEVFRTSPLAMLVSDAGTGRISAANEALQSLFGYRFEQLLNSTTVALGFWVDDTDREETIAVMRRDGKAVGREVRFRKANGEAFWARGSFSFVEWDGHTRILTSVEDISAQKKAEEDHRATELALRQAQTLDALGRMTGGIAHDFNNILAGMMANIELLQKSPDRREADEQRLASLKQGALRARDLIRQILAFSRQQPPTKQTVEMAPLVREASQSLATTLPASIRLQLDLGVCPPASADPTQLLRVLLNLGQNAIQALGDGPGTVRFVLATAPGPLPVELVVADDGAGIPPEALPRIFEPFFTTKAAGAGTGLGLSVVHGIVREHGGTIAVDSAPSKGTRVTIRLPAAEGAARVAGAHRAAEMGSGERLLVVDDDALVLETLAALLEQMGYRVDAHATLATAAEALEAHPSHYDLVLSDVHLGSDSGIAWAARIHARHPQLPVVLISGNPEVSPLSLRARGIAGLITKPVLGEELAAELNRVFRSLKEG